MIINQAVKFLKEDKIIAIPTETVYGLAGNALSDKAIETIYAIKNRPNNNPLICHFYNIEQVKKYVEVSYLAEVLLQKFSPGPLTLILPLKSNTQISSLVNNKLPTLAIRIPKHPIALDIIKKLELPVAMPSANLSGKISPTLVEHIQKDLENKISLIVPSYGSYFIGIESTICLLENRSITILRPGYITIKHIQQVLSDMNIHADINVKNNHGIISPGLLHKHYAPNKSVRINALDNFKDYEFIIGFGQVKCHLNLSPNSNLIEAAQNLFNYLHIADQDDNFTHIAITLIPNIDVGIAINDRIKRASND